MKTLAGVASSTRMTDAEDTVRAMMERMNKRFEHSRTIISEARLCVMEGSVGAVTHDIDVHYDARRRCLTLEREHWGRGTLYWCRADGRLFFSSEIKALFAVSGLTPEPDALAIAENFIYWMPSGNRTVFNRIHRLCAGERLVISAGRAHVIRTRPPRISGGRVENEATAAGCVHSLIGEQTARLTAKADASVALYLSGGLDSAVLLGELAWRGKKPFEVFCLTFADRSVNEGAFQRYAIEHTPNAPMVHTVEIDARELACRLDDTIRDIETPIMKLNPVALTALADEVVRCGFRYIMSGEGADEMFYGYDFFKETAVRVGLKRKRSAKEREALLFEAYGARANGGYLESYLMRYPATRDPLCSLRPRFESSKAILDCIIGGRAMPLAASERSIAAGVGRRGTPLERCQRLVMRTLLPEYLATQQAGQVLANRRLNGLFPFMENSVLSLSRRIPDRLKLHGAEGKFILKKAYADEVPVRILSREKYQLTSPGADSLPVELLARSDMSDESLRSLGLFDPVKVAQLTRHDRAASSGFDVSSYLYTYILTTQALFRIARNEWAKER